MFDSELDGCAFECISGKASESFQHNCNCRPISKLATYCEPGFFSQQNRSVFYEHQDWPTKYPCLRKTLKINLIRRFKTIFRPSVAKLAFSKHFNTTYLRYKDQLFQCVGATWVKRMPKKHWWKFRISFQGLSHYDNSYTLTVKQNIFFVHDFPSKWKPRSPTAHSNRKATNSCTK